MATVPGMATADAFASLTPAQRQALISSLQDQQTQQSTEHEPNLLEKLVSLGRLLPASHVLNPADLTGAVSALLAYAEHGEQVLEAAADLDLVKVREFFDRKAGQAPADTGHASAAGSLGPIGARPGAGDQVIPQTQPPAPAPQPTGIDTSGPADTPEATVINSAASAVQVTPENAQTLAATPAAQTPPVAPPAPEDADTTITDPTDGQEKTLTELFQELSDVQAEIASRGHAQSATVTTTPADSEPQS